MKTELNESPSHRPYIKQSANEIEVSRLREKPDMQIHNKIYFIAFAIWAVSLCSTLKAGFASGNMSAYWGDAKLIAIGSVGKPFAAVPGETARYYLTVTELIRGPKLDSIENIEVVNPAYDNSNSRWNTGLPGDQSVFFGKWDDKEQVWVVAMAAKLNDPIREAITILRYVDSSKGNEERGKRLEESLEKHDVQTVLYLLAEARRLNREDLIIKHLQWRFRIDPTDLNAADELFRLSDMSPLPQLKEFLADPDFQISNDLSARGEIARILSNRLKKDATGILRPYINDEDEFVALAVANHLMQVEGDSNKWKEIFHLAQGTTNSTIRHNACWSLYEGASQIPLEGLKEIRDLVHKHEVSVAILDRLDTAIDKREVKPTGIIKD